SLRSERLEGIRTQPAVGAGAGIGRFSGDSQSGRAQLHHALGQAAGPVRFRGAHASACRRVRAVLVGWTPDLFDAADRRVLTRRAVQRELDTVLAGLASDLRRRVSALRVCSPAARQAAGTVRTAVP